MVGLMVLGLVSGGAAWSGQSRPTVLELFTSEGCSSCPPAEAFLGELAQRPDVFTSITGMASGGATGLRFQHRQNASASMQRMWAVSLSIRHSCSWMAVKTSWEAIGRQSAAPLRKRPRQA